MGIGIDIETPQFIVLNAALSECDDRCKWNEVSTDLALHVIRSLEALGHLAHATDGELASGCGWIGSEDLFVTMLMGSGWLARDDSARFRLGPAWDECVVLIDGE